MNATQLEIDRPGSAKTTADMRREAGVKTILLHAQNDSSLPSRIDAALAIARACGAHIDCLHITPIEAYVAFDSFGGVFVINDVMKAIDEETERIRQAVNDELRNEDVTWDYTEVTANVASQLVARSALADLLVTGRDPHRTDFSGPALGLLGDLLYRSATPLFIPGDGAAPPDPAGAAVIAWDGSYSAANAVRSSIGLLKIAGRVDVLQVTEDKDEAFPGTRLLEYLSRHGIRAEMFTERAPASGPTRHFISGALIGHAQAVNAAYLVMGGYSHSRFGEFIVGGVTRNLLAASPVGIVINR